MKKLLLILVLCGCVATPYDPPIPSKTLRNPRCINSDRAEVFQYGQDTTLLNLYMCQTKLIYIGTNECKNHKKHNGYMYEFDKQLVAIKTKDFIGKDTDMKNHLYDGSVIGFGGCVVPDGTYSYTTAMGVQKTVQKVKYAHGEEAAIPNPAYAEWLAEQEKKSQDKAE